MKLKQMSMVAAVALVMFAFVEVAEAGKTGISRTRPGSGFHNRPSGSAYAARPVQRWQSPGQSYAKPWTVNNQMRQIVSPGTILHRSYVGPMHVVPSAPTIVSERVISPQQPTVPGTQAARPAAADAPQRK
jgi:hypothetical protein